MIKSNYLKCLFLLVAIAFVGCKDPEPVASFTVDKETAEVGEEITFTNTSTDATDFSWDFGDGEESSKTNPTHAYEEEGEFTVELTATGEGGTSYAEQDLTITYPEPIANFTVNKTTAETGEPVIFTNTSEYATDYEWNFGDGNKSYLENAVNLYADAGVYTATLKASGDGGENTKTQSITITESAFNIIPGIRISSFNVGDNYGVQITKLSGSPYHVVYQVDDGVYLHLMLWTNFGIGFWIYNNSPSNVSNSDIPNEIISVEPFPGKTQKGITYGSSFSEVEAAYGAPDVITSSGGYVYNTLGIFFGADNAQIMVDQIDVYDPGSKKSTNSIPERDVQKIIRSGKR